MKHVGGGSRAVVDDVVNGRVDEGEPHGEGEVDEHEDYGHGDDVEQDAADVDGPRPHLVVELHPVHDAADGHDGGEGVEVTGPEQHILNYGMSSFE